MLANFFSIGNRNYLNNAVVIAHALEFINENYPKSQNFKIQFKKPFLSQGEFTIGTVKVDGHIMGQFICNDVQFYFSYAPTDIKLEDKNVSSNDIENTITPFTLCYHITDACRGVIETGFEKVYGPMTEDDKVIFAVFEIPNTSVFSDVIESKIIPKITISEAEQTGDRRFKTSVFFNGVLLGHRHSTVRKFIV